MILKKTAFQITNECRSSIPNKINIVELGYNDLGLYITPQI
jgi:hypothetical protein